MIERKIPRFHVKVNSYIKHVVISFSDEFIYTKEKLEVSLLKFSNARFIGDKLDDSSAELIVRVLLQELVSCGAIKAISDGVWSYDSSLCNSLSHLFNTNFQYMKPHLVSTIINESPEICFPRANDFYDFSS
jgi:hypothetical protein